MDMKQQRTTVTIEDDIYKEISEANLQRIVGRTIEVEFSPNFIEKYHLPYEDLKISILHYLQAVHPSYQDYVRQTYKEVLKQEPNTIIPLEYPIRLPELERYVWLSVRLYRTEDNKVYGAAVDSTELKRSQFLREKTVKDYEMIVNQMSDLVVRFKTDGEIIYANQKACDLLGIEDFDHANLFTLTKTSQNSEWFKQLSHPPHQSEETLHYESYGKGRYISWVNTALFHKNEMTSVIAVGHDVTALKEINIQLDYEAHFDKVTGFLNQNGAEGKLKEWVEKKRHFAFAYLQIANLTEIRDLFGRETHDSLIETISSYFDTYSSDRCIIGRWRDHEFIFIVEYDSEAFHLIKTELLEYLNQTFTINERSLYLVSSMGFAVYPEDTTDIDLLVSYADIAMIEARRSNYNFAYRFNHPLYLRLQERIELANDLKTALQTKGITLVHQEIIDAKTNTVDYIETLARWQHPKRGFISPEVFFQIAEETGLVYELDYYILDQALGDFQQIKQLPRYRTSKLTVNISPKKLLNPNFPLHLKQLIEKHEIPHELIVIEINENTFVNNMKDCLKQINHLKNLGVVVALDDFGIKYSSLSILDELKFDIIKVDKSFVNKITQPTTQSILKMIHEISLYTEVGIIIEGVENEEQLNILKSLGFHLIQGYYFSKPKRINFQV